jgi:hypothetical protein
MTATKASNILYTIYAMTFTPPTSGERSRTTYAPVPHANATSRTIYTRSASSYLCPMPMVVWIDIGLDFIEALPCVGGKSIILTVVDHSASTATSSPLHTRTWRSLWHRFYSLRSCAGSRHARQTRIKEFVSILSRLRTYILDVIGTLWN